MSRTVDIAQAQRQLPTLLAEARRGEDILLARDGIPVARLVAPDARGQAAPEPIVGPAFSRELLEDWVKTDAEILEMFRGHLLTGG